MPAERNQNQEEPKQQVEPGRWEKIWNGTKYVGGKAIDATATMGTAVFNFAKYLKNGDGEEDPKKKKDGWTANSVLGAFTGFTCAMFLLGGPFTIGLVSAMCALKLGKKIYDYNKRHNLNTPSEKLKAAYEVGKQFYGKDMPPLEEVLKLTKDENGKDLTEAQFNAKIRENVETFKKSEEGKKLLSDAKVQRMFKNAFAIDLAEELGYDGPVIDRDEEAKKLAEKEPERVEEAKKLAEKEPERVEEAKKLAEKEPERVEEAKKLAEKEPERVEKADPKNEIVNNINNNPVVNKEPHVDAVQDDRYRVENVYDLDNFVENEDEIYADNDVRDNHELRQDAPKSERVNEVNIDNKNREEEIREEPEKVEQNKAEVANERDNIDNALYGQEDDLGENLNIDDTVNGLDENLNINDTINELNKNPRINDTVGSRSSGSSSDLEQEAEDREWVYVKEADTRQIANEQELREQFNEAGIAYDNYKELGAMMPEDEKI